VSKSRRVLAAVVYEKRPISEVAAVYGVHRSWIYKLLSRYEAEGDTAFVPRSKKPHTSPSAIPTETMILILKIHGELAGQGLDAGAHTICWHLATHHHITVSAATVWRYLKKAELIEPQPKKKPKSAYIRFEASLPSETWQTDFTHHRLADGTDTEILTFLDDHSRYALAVTAHRRVAGPTVVATFRKAVAAHGVPASVLSDNGLVFTTRFARGGKHDGRNGFEHELARLGVTQKNSRPTHPTTCGKVERFQQTMKKWLRAHPAPATITELQQHIDQFIVHYNTARPHRSLSRRTPLAAWISRPKATPQRSPATTHYLIRHDRVDDAGKVTLRHAGKLHHIGIGRRHARTRIILLIENLHVRVAHGITGALLQELHLDPNRGYQPQQQKTP
jgi:transposase InsO family protein